MMTSLAHCSKPKMATAEVGGELITPNLRIEIENDFIEDMETDVLSDSKDSTNALDEDLEDGELSDANDVSSGPKSASTMGAMGVAGIGSDTLETRYANKAGGFVTGVDIFGEEEQSKLGVRAKRFGLDASKVNPLTEQELKKLYESVGVNVEEEGTDKTFRLHALHMRGTEDMSTEDIFSYFKAYGPASIEWINDVSCNVVWLDDISASRALIGLSKPVKVVEKMCPQAESPKLEKELLKDGTEEVVVVVTREDESDDDDVQMGDDSKNQEDGEKLPGGATKCSEVDDAAVDVSNITIPVPPGKWRVGLSHPKAKNVLLRFATRSDKKHPQAEKLSQYYKKYGNPNYGGIRGLLTESRKRRYRREERPIARRDLDDQPLLNEVVETLNDVKNPWGALAKTWSGSRERGPPQVVHNKPDGRSILDRIGASGDRSEGSQSSDSEEVERSTRSKVPRMRMYADDEEVKIEKRKARRKVRAKENTEELKRDDHRDDLRYKLKRDAPSRIVADDVGTRGQDRHDIRSRVRVPFRNRRDDCRHTSEEESESEQTPPRISSTVLSKRLQQGMAADRLPTRSTPMSVSSKRRMEEDDDNMRRRTGLGERSKHVSDDCIRVPAKISSTVWSRLRHQRTEGRLSYDEDYEVDRRRKNTPESDIPSAGDSDDEPVVQRQKLQSGFAGDLRSKLNSKKTVGQKSPLRIEIDNDEYYRLIGSDNDDE